jgi:hypothetical protein
MELMSESADTTGSCKTRTKSANLCTYHTAVDLRISDKVTTTRLLEVHTYLQQKRKVRQ